MKKTVIFSGVVCLLLTLSARAGLVCTNSVFDYGTVSASTSPKHVFQLQNTGTNTVRILKVRASCGCVATAASKKVVAPGETAEINVRVSLKGRSGRQHKTVFVQTDSPETPLLRLEAKGVALRAGVSATPPASALIPAPAMIPAPVSTPAIATTPVPRPSNGLHAVPYEIRLPGRASAQGLVTFVAIKDDDHPEFKMESIVPPDGVAYKVTKNRDGYIIKLGPISDPQALVDTVVTVSTTSGTLTLPVRVSNP